MSRIDKEGMVKEARELMKQNKPIVCADFMKQFSCSNWYFYTALKEAGLDVSSYNRNLKADKPSFTIEKREEIFSSNEQPEESVLKADNFEIVRGKKSSDKFSFKINPQFVNATANNYETETITEEAQKVSSDDIVDYVPNSQQYIIAGLISKRHNEVDATVNNTFIYSGPIKSDMIHDYDKLYDVALNFVRGKVKGAGYNKLKVMVTGLTQCVTAVIKACIDEQVNLILLHYDNASYKYKEQLIIGSTSDSEFSLLELFASSKKGYKFQLIGHNSKYYESLDSFYTVKVENLSVADKTVVYITDDISKMFKVYGDEVQKSLTNTFESIRIISNEVTFGATNAEYSFKNTFGSFCNKK